MHPLPLLHERDSVLLLVDMQTRLAASMEPPEWEGTRASAARLATAAGTLGIPVIATRQYPDGLGDIDPELAGSLPAATEILDKTCFAASRTEGVAEALAMTGRSQVLLGGMEAHVCVLQTAADLLERGLAPFVAADAVCSRSPGHKNGALARMRSAGVNVTDHEAALFEWLRDARHEHFKAVSKLLK